MHFTLIDQLWPMADAFYPTRRLLSDVRAPPSTTVCPSKGRVNPGRLSSPTWKRPSNGCLPQSANALAEAEGGSGAGAALWRGSSARSRSLIWDCCRLCPPLSCYAIRQSQRVHTADRRGGVYGEELCFFFFLSLGVRDECLLRWVSKLTIKKV